MLQVKIIYLITSTTLSGIHNRVGSNLSVSLQITHPVQERLATPPGSMYPTFFEQWCRFFYIPQEPDLKWKCCETGPMVCCPYPRKLESLTVCRCHCKGSTFWPWVFLRPGFEPATSSSADKCFSDCANQVAVICYGCLKSWEEFWMNYCTTWTKKNKLKLLETQSVTQHLTGDSCISSSYSCNPFYWSFLCINRFIDKYIFIVLQER